MLTDISMNSYYKGNIYYAQSVTYTKYCIIVSIFG